MNAEIQIPYALSQYQLCCKYLNIPQRHDANGNTLIEALIELQKDRDEWKEEAALRSKETEVFKHNVQLLADELKSENKKAIDWFIGANEIKQSLQIALQWLDDIACQEVRDLIVNPLHAKHFTGTQKKTTT